MRLMYAPLIALLLTGCGGDPLSGEYDAFEGEWHWFETPTKEEGVFNNISDSITPSLTGYTATLEMTAKGTIKLFKNDELITENDYTIADKESNSGSIKMIIKMKGDIGGLNLDDKRLMLILRDDELEVDRFPFHALEDADVYHSGHNSVGNEFRR